MSEHDEVATLQQWAAQCMAGHEADRRSEGFRVFALVCGASWRRLVTVVNSHMEVHIMSTQPQSTDIDRRQPERSVIRYIATK